MMIVAEIIGGTYYGSMALVADGWHMATHAAALGVATLAYRYARRHAADPRFTFGTGKVGELAGFASAISLAIVALLIAPNRCSACTTRIPSTSCPRPAASPCSGSSSIWSAPACRTTTMMTMKMKTTITTTNTITIPTCAPLPDVLLADALTSVLAILRPAGRVVPRLDLRWMPLPACSAQLSSRTGRWASPARRAEACWIRRTTARWKQAVRRKLQAAPGNVVISDLHLWRLGPGQFGLIVSLRGPAPCTPDQYRAEPALPQLRHVTIETNTT